MYPLTPPVEVLRARARFPYGEICRCHDASGAPGVVAVLTPRFQRTGSAVLVCAATVAELAEVLDGQPRPPLPRRDWYFP